MEMLTESDRSHLCQTYFGIWNSAAVLRSVPLTEMVQMRTTLPDLPFPTVGIYVEPEEPISSSYATPRSYSLCLRVPARRPQ
jgi:hypothetical protein